MVEKRRATAQTDDVGLETRAQRFHRGVTTPHPEGAPHTHRLRCLQEHAFRLPRKGAKVPLHALGTDAFLGERPDPDFAQEKQS
jgi:hypothetical protein